MPPQRTHWRPVHCPLYGANQKPLEDCVDLRQFRWWQVEWSYVRLAPSLSRVFRSLNETRRNLAVFFLGKKNHFTALEVFRKYFLNLNEACACEHVFSDGSRKRL